MFTSPSVRVKRRQTALRTPAVMSQAESATKESGLKSETNHLVWQSHINGQQDRAGPNFAPQVLEDEGHENGSGNVPNRALTAANDIANVTLSVAGSGSSIFASGDLYESTSYRDTSDGDAHTLLRGDKHAVIEVSSFPETVRKLLGSVDLRSVPITAGLSCDSGFAFVATPTTCLVWSYSRSTSSMDSVYKLAMPDPQSSAIYEAPVVALAGTGERQSDVGLLSCSATGEVRYWDRVVFGLGGTDRFYSKSLELLDTADRCTHINEVYPNTFIIATRKGSLYHVSLHNTQGTAELNARLLSKNSGARSGMLSRVSSLLGGGAYSSSAATAIGAGDALVSLAGGGRTEIRHSREFFVLSREKLFKWIISRSQPERFVYSLDISRTLGDSVAQKVGADAEILTYDVAVARGGNICLLLGLRLPQRQDEIQMSIAVFRSDQVLTEPDFLGLWILENILTESLSQEGAERPRLTLPERGPAMYVVSRNAVIVAIVPTFGVAFEEAIFFRDDDFVLGMSDINKHASRSSQESPESSLAISCFGAGVLNVSAHTGKIFSSAALADNTREGAEASYATRAPDLAVGWPDSKTQVGKPSCIDSIERGFKNQIEQAVFFGMDNSQNPLSFAISSQASGVDIALENAALRVSQSIINNTSHFIADRLDLGAHLKERLHRARSVMLFVSGNGLTEQLSLGTRVQLCAHAERLAAANALWEYQNDIWAKNLGPASQLLANLVASFLESIGLQSKDALRVFFKHHVASIGDMLVFMHRNLAALRKALENSESGIRDSQHIAYEANRIVIAVLQSAFTFRFQNAHLYGTVSYSDSSDALSDTNDHKGALAENWTEHSAIIDLLLERLEGSYSLCRDISGRHCSAIYERIEKTNLPSADFAGKREQQTLSVFDDAVSVDHAPAEDSSNSTHGSRDINSDMQARLETDNPYKSSLALLYATINQMGPLANLCFRAFVDRIAFLYQTCPNDAARLSCCYEAIRPRYLLCLVPIGRAPIAFRLAEEYRDLASLIMLAFTTDRANAAEHMRNYVGRFGKEFADTLFIYYERRQAWASLLYTQDENFDEWLKQFIDQKSVDDTNSFMAQIGWIHDVKLSDFAAAAAKLTRAGRDSDDVDQARTMLSLGKLAFAIVEGQEIVQSDTVTKAHTRLEDALEMCEVQESLMRYFTALIRELKESSRDQIWRRRDDINDRKAYLDVAMLTTTPECRHSYPALYTIYGELVRRIWNGTTLGVEDLIDVLTFPDNTNSVGNGNTSNDADCTDRYNQLVHDRCALAIDILSRASFNLPERTREAALRTIWRRVFLSDDWREITKKLSGNVPDSILRVELLNTRLYSVLKSCVATRELAHPIWYVLPTDALATDDTDYLVNTRLGPQFTQEPPASAKWRPLSIATSAALIEDYTEEDKRLRVAIDSGLGGYYDEILRVVMDEINKNEASDTQSLDSGNADDDVAMDSD
ncbi:hypothetical protein EV178_006460 [Coemansia sp. RSA 1646]|nr:hypothetical protein EV178_006460 [Coemansia sp. RSA 1646]KAJ2085169.1 hypothetical protein IW138_006463 [Coemansia sp. RSA 986]